MSSSAENELPTTDETLDENILTTNELMEEENAGDGEPDASEFLAEEPPPDVPSETSSAVESTPPRPVTKQTKIALGVGAVALFFLVYLLRINNIVGLYVDDGWYVLLAKSLATGQGYALLNSPTPGVLPLYPPGWPFILSWLYRVYPHFPDNVWALKLISIAAMGGAGWFTYLLFSQVRLLPRMIALLLAFVSVLTPAMVYFATETLMSECIFMFFLMVTIYVVERNLQEQQLLKYFALVGALGGYAFLVRSTGLALLAGIGLTLLLGKYIRPLLVFCAIAALFTLPWIIYSRVHAPTPAAQAEQNTYIVYTYTGQFWQRVAGDDESGEIGVAELPARVWNNILQLSIRDMGRIVISQITDYLTFEEIKNRALSGDGQQVEFTKYSWLSLIPSLLILIGFVATLREKIRVGELVVFFSVALTMLWPFESVRFVLPLVPFLLFYLVRGLQPLANLNRKLNLQEASRPHYGVAYVVLGFIAVLNVVGNLGYAYQMRGAPRADLPRQNEVFSAHQELFQWVDEALPKDAVLAVANPPLTYMFTERKTVGMGNPARQWELWKKIGVSHMVFTAGAPLGPPDEDEARFRIAYKSPGRMNLRVLDLGPVNDRKNWGAASK